LRTAPPLPEERDFFFFDKIEIDDPVLTLDLVEGAAEAIILIGEEAEEEDENTGIGAGGGGA